MAQAQESVRIATIRFENGMITTVELTDTQLALIQSKVNRLQAQHDYVIGLGTTRKSNRTKNTIDNFYLKRRYLI